MIIFTPFPQTKEWLMSIRPERYHFYEYNLSSPYNIGIPLEALIPNPEYFPDEVLRSHDESPDFDIAYFNFIANSKEAFFTFMSLVLPLYDDPEACVIIYYSQGLFRDMILEYLSKFIQARYGYNSYIINEPGDLECVKDNGSFGVRGIIQIQEDAELALVLGYYGPIEVPKEE